MTTLYGITNCTTVKKARDWLAEKNIQYDFHDYKKLGIDNEHLQKWCNELGWENVLNRRGMMWKKATEKERDAVKDTESAIEFMIKTPTSIKRPIIEKGGKLILGFDVAEYKGFFG